MNTAASLLIASLCVTGAFAGPYDAEESEVRTIYDTGSGLYLGLNSTLLWIAAFGVVTGALVYFLFGDVIFGAGGLGSAGYQQRYDNYYNYEQQQQQDYRNKRSINENMVTKMLQLEQVFKKYEVEEDECRAYVACEAANVERLVENGPLVQQVHEFFTTINHSKPEHLAKINNNKAMFIMKQAYDSAKVRQQEHDVCKPLREACQGRRQQKKN